MNAVLEIPVLAARSIVLSPPLSDDEFEQMSMRTELAVLERTKEDVIAIRAISGAMTSSANAAIISELAEWSRRSGAGRSLMHCSFFLTDGSCLSPDAAYVTAEQLAGLSRSQLARFPRLAPAFVIELLSASDRLNEAAAKMQSWMANGVKLGWFVDPYARQVHVYEEGRAPRIAAGGRIAGSGPVEGFVLDAEEVWRCFE